MILILDKIKNLDPKSETLKLKIDNFTYEVPKFLILKNFQKIFQIV